MSDKSKVTPAKSKLCNKSAVSFTLRLTISVVAVAFLTLNSLTNITVIVKEPVCIEDEGINKTTEIYNYLIQHMIIKHLWMIGTFGFLDISIIFLSVFWILKGKNWRPILNFLLLFSFRAFCNYVLTLKDHDKMNWEYPNFPSLFVSYKRSKNSFFSAHVGLYLFCGLEYFENNFYIMSFVSFLGMISYSILSLSLRVEYFISLIAGIFASHYIFMITKQYHNKLSLLLGSISVRKIIRSHVNLELSTQKNYDGL